MSEIEEYASVQELDEDDDLFERRISRMRERHWSVLLICSAVICLSLCLQVADQGRVAMSGWGGLRLPELCSSRAWFGVTCPGCGLTRSFIHFAHGRFGESIACNRVGWVLAIIVVLQIPYRIYLLRQSPVGGLNSRWPSWVSMGLITMLIGNWVLLQVGF